MHSICPRYSNHSYPNRTVGELLDPDAEKTTDERHELVVAEGFRERVCYVVNPWRVTRDDTALVQEEK